MEYKIYRIADRTQIDQCELFAINQYLWNSLQTPKAYGRAGYIDGQGIYVEMTCEECDPKRLCNKDKELVYKDSALEAFFAFPEGDISIEKQCIYINFEMNANGALYAEKGYTRENRTLISDVYYQEADCRAKIESDRWCVSVLIPEALLGEITSLEELKAGQRFYCNFYKISEDDKIQHFGCYSPIESEEPNFHLPICFAKAVIADV
ncbi:carbohydrate-binding family 9-like protein [Faecalimonas umbilicata]|uniref:carbohydrate-binding family 9-like protein n=1 Tax=Faecalimonas umbilicata TaxID=1912855 RepID=UPI0022E94704|nr:carbohydrate-binding family 9-like protein [Faecalimonas umbilicata]